MYLHTFEVVAPDGDVVSVQAFTVATPHRHVRVRHRLVELEPPSAVDPYDESAIQEWDWDDFVLDER